jgi:hypothetical protein
MMRIQRGDHHLADLAIGQRLAGARANNSRITPSSTISPSRASLLIGDQAEIGGAIALQHRQPARRVPRAAGWADRPRR